MNITRNFYLNQLKQCQRRFVAPSIRWQTTQAASNQATSNEEGTTHFGFQTIRESEKVEKGR